MEDSWEDNDRFLKLSDAEAPVPKRAAPAFSLNPGAASFTFNPGAAVFQPVLSAPPASTAATCHETEVTGGLSHASDIDQGVVNGDETAAGSGIDESPSSLLDSKVLQEVKALKLDEQGTSPEAQEGDAEEETAESSTRGEEELKRIYEELSKEDTREHMNIVFIGHVDAGKSTIGGQILYLTGGVDERTIQKYEKEAKDKNRESWYMAYIMDTNEEERAKGKTVEVGRAHFETAKKRYTILDAPGHKNYVPNMIGGAAQADVGVLVIAARKGEFETGFERGGQTREHAQLARTLGVSKLIVVVNKMDDPSTLEAGNIWSQTRFAEIEAKLVPFLKSCGYNPKRDLVFLPISGLLGYNIKDPVPKDMCPWYKGGTLFEILDSLSPLPFNPLEPFRMSVIDKYKDMGTIAMGKSEAGLVCTNDELFVMPNRVPVKVSEIVRDETVVHAAKGGENLRLKLSGISEDELQAGFIICSRRQPVPAVTSFEAQLQLLDLLEHKSIFTAGYKCILHIHSLVEECEATKLIYAIDLKTKEQKKVKFVKSGSIVVARIAVEKPICVEKFERVPQLGRFTLRDEGRTIAIGKIIRVPKSQ